MYEDDKSAKKMIIGIVKFILRKLNILEKIYK
jgi:hypothetical protein